MDDQDKTDPGLDRAGRPRGGKRASPPQIFSVTDELTAVTWKKPEIGDIIGSYRVMDYIGGGGMALIYRAQHLRLGREVALKVLRPQLANQVAQVLRFFEEARAVNEIQHPNIVEVIDFVEDRDVSPPMVYMVMELLTGQDLHTRIYSEPALTPVESMEIARQVLSALGTVHQKNVLHRDLKPSNIFLVEQPSGPPLVKVLDFGLVKAFGDRAGQDLTSPNVLVGTPEFMAPEQVLGGELDQRTDLYTFGLVFYEMVARRRPFEGERGEVLVKQAKDPAPPFTDEQSSKMERSLEAVILHCLEKEPDARPGSAAEVMEALAAIRATPPSDEANLKDGRWKWAIGIFGILTLALALVVPRLTDRSPEVRMPLTIPAADVAVSATPTGLDGAVDASPSEENQRRDLDAPAVKPRQPGSKKIVLPQPGKKGEPVKEGRSVKGIPKKGNNGEAKPVEEPSGTPLSGSKNTPQPDSPKPIGEGTVNPFAK